MKVRKRGLHPVPATPEIAAALAALEAKGYVRRSERRGRVEYDITDAGRLRHAELLAKGLAALAESE